MKKSIHSKNSVVSTQLTEDHDPKYLFFIDGVFYQQKGFASELEAMKAGKEKLAELLINEIISFLNDYPKNQNERPVYVISSDGLTLLYYRKWYDRNPELSLPIEEAKKCTTPEGLQKMMGV